MTLNIALVPCDADPRPARHPYIGVELFRRHLARQAGRQTKSTSVSPASTVPVTTGIRHRPVYAVLPAATDVICCRSRAGDGVR